MLRRPEEGAVGLLLLLLKDLLSGALPVGGTSAVGRGVLQGDARLHFPNGDEVVFDPARPADPAHVVALNAWVQAFVEAPALQETAP